MKYTSSKSIPFYMLKIVFNLFLIITCLFYSQRSANAACANRAPLRNPNALTFDNSNTDLYLANAGANEVLEFSVNRNSHGVATGLTQINCVTTGVANPTRLVFDSNGNLYVTNMSNDTVTVYDRNLSLISGDTIDSGIQRPLGIAIDQDNNVYIANNATNSIAVFQPKLGGGFKQATFSPLTHDGAGNQFLAPGVLFYSNSSHLLYVGLGPTTTQDRMLAYATPLSATSMPSLSQPDSRCDSSDNLIVSGPTGIAQILSVPFIFYTNYYNSEAIAFTWPGTPSYCTGPINSSFSSSQVNGIHNPEGIAVHSFDEIYVSNSSSNTITEYGNQWGKPNFTY